MSLARVTEFRSKSGKRIFRLPLRAFPGFWVYAYLVLIGNSVTLIDTGSGFGTSNDDLAAGFEQVVELIGCKLTFADISDILISHAHIDHFGGLGFLKSQTNARIGVHELDRGVLTNFEERLAIISRKMRSFLMEAGISEASCEKIIAMYLFSKALYRSIEVDFTYEAQGNRYGPFTFLHVPGHSPGHVIIRMEDVLFVGDHVLNEISPHQAPESLAPSTGLAHYFESLVRADEWGEDVRLVLPGHKTPIANFSQRIKEIQKGHAERLNQLLSLLVTPHTIAELSRKLFKEVNGYTIILALEETGAHIEYLYQRGLLGVSNLDEIINQNEPVPIQYIRLYETGNPVPYAERMSYTRTQGDSHVFI